MFLTGLAPRLSHKGRTIKAEFHLTASQGTRSDLDDISEWKLSLNPLYPKRDMIAASLLSGSLMNCNRHTCQSRRHLFRRSDIGRAFGVLHRKQSNERWVEMGSDYPFLVWTVHTHILWDEVVMVLLFC